MKTLAELDSLICQIEESFQIGTGGKPTMYKSDVANKNPILYDLNQYLLKQDKTVYVEQLDHVYQFGIMSPNIPVQYEYTAKDIKNDGKFLYEAIGTDGLDPTYRLRVCFTRFVGDTWP